VRQAHPGVLSRPWAGGWRRRRRRHRL